MTTPKPSPSPATGPIHPLVIFDLDGTLIDTAPDLVDSLNHTIATLGLEPFAIGAVRHLVGHGARVMIERAVTVRGVAAGSARIESLLDVFLNHYAAAMPGRSEPFPGLVEALMRLRSAGVSLAVCTNKKESLARRLLDSIGLSRHFTAITGGDTFAARKPDGAHITGTIERAGGRREQAVMIGDSINDIAAAHDAGIVSLAVPFGYSADPVETLGATRILEQYDDLTVDLIRQLLAVQPGSSREPVH